MLARAKEDAILYPADQYTDADVRADIEALSAEEEARDLEEAEMMAALEAKERGEDDGNVREEAPLTLGEQSQTESLPNIVVENEMDEEDEDLPRLPTPPPSRGNLV